MCPRNQYGGKDAPYLTYQELKLEDVKKILSIDFIKNLKTFLFCGNFGDPSIAQDSLEIIKWLKDVNPKLKIRFLTNGGTRKPPWWKNLGSLLSQEGDYCEFSIDGLADTNHIYRRRTDFDKIIENAKAFIDAGGNANWIFIPFEHNEHQIDEAKQLSYKMGFKKFIIRKTSRFLLRTEYPVHDMEGNIEYYLKPPGNLAYRNITSILENMNQKIFSKDVINKQTNLEKQSTNKKVLEKLYKQSINIDCRSLVNKEIYIASDGTIWPCCFTHSAYTKSKQIDCTKEEQIQIKEMIENNGGIVSINAFKNDLNDILRGEIFNAIKNSWNSLGKLNVCAFQCNKSAPLSKHDLTVLK
jgi:hypothetical protein